MNENQIVKAKHQNNGSMVEFDLVATELKRQGEGSAKRYFPFFKEEDQNLAKLIEIFGEESITDFAVDAIRVKFQSLYFIKSPSYAPIPVMGEDGKQKTVKDKDGKDIPVTKEDETPRIPEFLKSVEDENLSGRTFDTEYYMRKATNILSGIDKKWKDKSKEERMVEASKYMIKAQECMQAAMAKS